MKKSLVNHNCSIFYNEERKEIYGHDLIDKYNDQKFYSTKIRGLKKGWQQLEKEFNQLTTMFGAVNILNKFNCQCHSWCGMD